MGNGKDMNYQRQMMNVYSLWGFYIASNLLNIVVYGNLSFWLMLTGLFINSIATYIVFKFKDYIISRCLIVTFIYVNIFIIINTYHHITNYMIVLVGLMLTILFLDYKMLLLSGLYSISLNIYIFYKYGNTIFSSLENKDLVFLVAFTVITVIFLLEVVKYINNFITKIKDSEEKIRDIAYKDSLTGLNNRVLFNEYFDMSIMHSSTKDSKLGVMFIDLDNFKIVNDSYGHQIGDTLLQKVANRFRSAVKHTDMIFRIGGDEFVVLLRDIDEEDIIKVADRIDNLFSYPFSVEGNTIKVDLSVGISVYPDNGDNMDRLMSSADSSMYYAKKHGLRYKIS